MIEAIFAAFCAYGAYKIYDGSSSPTARGLMFLLLGLLVFTWFT